MLDEDPSEEESERGEPIVKPQKENLMSYTTEENIGKISEHSSDCVTQKSVSLTSEVTKKNDEFELKVE